ncbi:MAG: hypothetical protein QOJ85_519, partial [Solirubrobacteraceae bacterium]|nr:hypothetical protein [Solirubrobacteraceae bacterium]
EVDRFGAGLRASPRVALSRARVADAGEFADDGLDAGGI